MTIPKIIVDNPLVDITNISSTGDILWEVDCVHIPSEVADTFYIEEGIDNGEWEVNSVKFNYKVFW